MRNTRAGLAASRGRSLEAAGPDMFALVEVFGGIFAVLLFIYFFTILVVGGASRALPPMNDPGDYRLSWPGKGSGWVVLVYPDRVLIPEMNWRADRGHMCEPASDYARYLSRVYVTRQDYLVFGIVQGGLKTMVEARECLIRHLGPNVRISTVIADREFLKAVGGESKLPAHIEAAFRNNLIEGRP